MELSVTLFIFSLLGLLLQIVGQQNSTEIDLQILKVKPGTSVSIKCPLKPNTNHFSLKWTFGCGENLADHQRYKNRTRLSEDNMEITISNLTKEDSGIYICHMESDSKEEKSGARVEMIPTPDPTDAEENQTCFTIYIIVGLETCMITILIVLITCRFSGYPRQKIKQKEEVETQEICYADVSTSRINQRPRTKGTEERTTYAAIKPRE
ncbi:uncharacterized protein [Phyllobates terribilis]|uniref:uncharacterized protein n=1 Tax=Phyllobates terribilis TaxID=111132 RepID=UPI003CCAC93E